MHTAFQILLTDVGRAALRRALALKSAAGQADQVLAALASLDARLGTAPLSAGQRWLDLPDLPFPVVTAFVSPLILDYAVDEQRHLIYIHHVRLGA